MLYNIVAIKFTRVDLVLHVFATIKKKKKRKGREEFRKASGFPVCLFDGRVRPITDLRSRYEEESYLDRLRQIPRFHALAVCGIILREGPHLPAVICEPWKWRSLCIESEGKKPGLALAS